MTSRERSWAPCHSAPCRRSPTRWSSWGRRASRTSKRHRRTSSASSADSRKPARSSSAAATMTWYSDMKRPGGSAANQLGAVRWDPVELELDGEPFGDGPAPHTTSHEATDNAVLVQQQALDDAFTHGFDAGREAGASAERARIEAPLAAVSNLLDELREREARWVERMEENLCALAVAVGRQ